MNPQLIAIAAQTLLPALKPFVDQLLGQAVQHIQQGKHPEAAQLLQAGQQVLGPLLGLLLQGVQPGATPKP